MTYAPDGNEHRAAALRAALPAYEVGGELGRGACGVVLAGRHRQLDRDVAIKQLPRAFGADAAVRERFVAEARVLAALDHPHIVEVYDFVTHDGTSLLVMERLTGGTLWSYLDAGGFTAEVSCALLLAVCAGLHHAHVHGVLHRDVKPENLMFSGDGTLKVVDLGIAKVVGGRATLASGVGEVLGTPAYMSPEQASGGDLTPATDVYQAGTLLFELLSGQLPFATDGDLATLMYRRVHESPPSLLHVAPGVPERLAMITDRAIAVSPTDRYQSAEDFGVAIAHAAAATWGRGWLARTNVPVLAAGPILTAALDEPARATVVSASQTIDTMPSDARLDASVTGANLAEQAADPQVPDAAHRQTPHEDDNQTRARTTAAESRVSVSPTRGVSRRRAVAAALALTLVVLLAGLAGTMLSAQQTADPAAAANAPSPTNPRASSGSPNDTQQHLLITRTSACAQQCRGLSSRTRPPTTTFASTSTTTSTSTSTSTSSSTSSSTSTTSTTLTPRTTLPRTKP